MGMGMIKGEGKGGKAYAYTHFYVVYVFYAVCKFLHLPGLVLVHTIHYLPTLLCLGEEIVSLSLPLLLQNT